MVKEAKRATGSGPGKPDLETLSVGKPKKDLKGWDACDVDPRRRNPELRVLSDINTECIHTIVVWYTRQTATTI